MPVAPILTISIERTGLPAIKKRDLNNMHKEAFRAMGEYWAEHMMPRHFEDGAEARYSFSPRSKNHMRRKWHHYRKRRPLVYSGQFMDEVTNKANQIIQPTFRRVTVRLRHHTVHEKARQDLARLDRAGNELRKLMSVFRNKMAELMNTSKARIMVKVRRR